MQMFWQSGHLAKGWPACRFGVKWVYHFWYITLIRTQNEIGDDGDAITWLLQNSLIFLHIISLESFNAGGWLHWYYFHFMYEETEADWSWLPCTYCARCGECYENFVPYFLSLREAWGTLEKLKLHLLTSLKPWGYFILLRNVFSPN